jgi:hypothetical protein
LVSFKDNNINHLALINSIIMQNCHFGLRCNRIRSRAHCSRFSHVPPTSATFYPLYHSVLLQTWVPLRRQCRYGVNCHDRRGADHRFQYDHYDKQQSLMCYYYDNCRKINDPVHCAKFSHDQGQPALKSMIMQVQEQKTQKVVAPAQRIVAPTQIQEKVQMQSHVLRQMLVQAHAQNQAMTGAVGVANAVDDTVVANPSVNSFGIPTWGYTINGIIYV